MTTLPQTMPTSTRCEVHQLYLPTYPTRRRSVLPPLYDIDNVYHFSTYPYSGSFTNDAPELKGHKVVEITNGLLKVTVIPDLGGRIYQIEDVQTGCCYLHENRCVRPTRVPPTWDFISLGIEFNFPYAHSPTGRLPVGYELISDPSTGMAGVAVGEVERQWGLGWRAEVRLYPGSRAVWVCVRCWNPTQTPRDVQWWSNAAQPGGADAEFIFPDEPIIAHIDGEGNGHWPHFNGIDLRYHRNYDRMVGAFIEPSTTDYFGIWHAVRGWGLLHLADPTQLPGKKLWSFGHSGPTSDWSLTMTRDGDTNVEIQSGLPPTQSAKHRLEPRTSFSFCEAWVPVDDRQVFDDGHRPSFAEMSEQAGLDLHVPSIAPIRQDDLASDRWSDLINLYQNARHEPTALAQLEPGLANDWPPTGMDLEAPLRWACGCRGGFWWYALGVYLAGTDRLEDAVKMLRSAIDHTASDDNNLVRAVLGLVLYRGLGRLNEAKPELLASARLLHDPELLRHADELLKAQGDLAGRKALLSCWPEDARGIEVRAGVLLDEGDFVGCLRLLEEYRWERHHCRYVRTKLWRTAHERLGLPIEPVPALLGEDPYVVSA